MWGRRQRRHSGRHVCRDVPTQGEAVRVGTRPGRGAGDSVCQLLLGMSEQTGRLDVAWTLRGQEDSPLWDLAVGPGSARRQRHREGRARGTSVCRPPDPASPGSRAACPSRCPPLASGSGLVLTCFSTLPVLLEATPAPADGGRFRQWDT